MRTFVAGLLALALSAGVTPAGAEPAPLHLSDVLEEARERNPEIRAARERAAAAAAVPRRVRALDDPTFSYELWNAPDCRVDRADNNILRLSQKVPFPGKRALAGEAATHDADFARSEVASVELDVRAAVRRAYYDLWGARELLGVYDRERALLDRLAHVATERYGTGAVPQSDVLRAQVERTHLVNRSATQDLVVQGAEAELNALLSRDPTEPLGVPEPPAPARLDETVAALTEHALVARPELAAQEAAVAREDAGIRLARRGYLPDFEFSVGRFLNPGARDGFGAMATVSIPIVNKGKYDAGVGEASARRASAEAELQRLRDRIRREVQQVYLR